MQYFAIGEDNGGAGERRLGPFDTAEEAQAAGEKETKESNGGFVFRGVVDKANNQVFTADDVTALNAKKRVAKNTKYKGCEIYIASHDPKDISRPGKTWIVKDVDGVSVGGFDSEAKAKAWVDAHPSRTLNSVRTSCPVVANAIAANRRIVARNAMTVEEQREFQKNMLPKYEAEVAKFVKDCDTIYSQVKAAVAKANGVASTLSALEKKVESMKRPFVGKVYDFDESKGDKMWKEVEAASRKIVDCRDMASKLGYDIVNSFRVYSV